MPVNPFFAFLKNSNKDTRWEVQLGEKFELLPLSMHVNIAKIKEEETENKKLSGAVNKNKTKTFLKF